jgi:hypothetical protein
MTIGITDVQAHIRQIGQSKREVASKDEFTFMLPSFMFHFEGNKCSCFFKFGGFFERMQNNILALSNPNGLFNYADLPHFLTNSIKSFQAGFANTLTPRNLRQSIVGVYL